MYSRDYMDAIVKEVQKETQEHLKYNQGSTLNKKSTKNSNINHNQIKERKISEIDPKILEKYQLRTREIQIPANLIIKPKENKKNTKSLNSKKKSQTQTPDVSKHVNNKKKKEEAKKSNNKKVSVPVSKSYDRDYSDIFNDDLCSISASNSVNSMKKKSTSVKSVDKGMSENTASSVRSQQAPAQSNKSLASSQLQISSAFNGNRNKNHSRLTTTTTESKPVPRANANSEQKVHHFPCNEYDKNRKCFTAKVSSSKSQKPIENGIKKKSKQVIEEEEEVSSASFEEESEDEGEDIDRERQKKRKRSRSPSPPALPPNPYLDRYFHEQADLRKTIRSLVCKPGQRAYEGKYSDDDDDDSVMEARLTDIEKEEERAARIAYMEDEADIKEEQRRRRERAEKKKRQQKAKHALNKRY